MLPFASTVAFGLNALSRMGGVFGEGDVLDRDTLAPDDFGRDGFGTGATGVAGAAGVVVSRGADTTGPEVFEGAIVVDCAVAVSAGVALLSAVVQPTTEASMNPAIACFMLSFIAFPFV